MMTSGGDHLLEGLGHGSTVQQAGAAPELVIVQAIEGMASADAGFAPGAGIEFDEEGILLAWAGPLERDQGAIELSLGRPLRGGLVIADEPVDSGELALLFEE